MKVKEQGNYFAEKLVISVCEDQCLHEDLYVAFSRSIHASNIVVNSEKEEQSSKRDR